MDGDHHHHPPPPPSSPDRLEQEKSSSIFYTNDDDDDDCRVVCKGGIVVVVVVGYLSPILLFVIFPNFLSPPPHFSLSLISSISSPFLFVSCLDKNHPLHPPPPPSWSSFIYISSSSQSSSPRERERKRERERVALACIFSTNRPTDRVLFSSKFAVVGCCCCRRRVLLCTSFHSISRVVGGWSGGSSSRGRKTPLSVW